MKVGVGEGGEGGKKSLAHSPFPRSSLHAHRTVGVTLRDLASCPPTHHIDRRSANAVRPNIREQEDGRTGWGGEGRGGGARARRGRGRRAREKRRSKKKKSSHA